jgi:hypothetical protein
MHVLFWPTETILPLPAVTSRLSGAKILWLVALFLYSYELRCVILAARIIAAFVAHRGAPCGAPEVVSALRELRASAAPLAPR